MRNGVVIASIATVCLSATPVLIAACGELLAERVGIFNIGIEGSMLVGAFLAVVVARATGSALLGVLAAMMAGCVGSLFFAIVVVLLRAELVMAGLALYFVVAGITVGLGGSYVGKNVTAGLPVWDIPVLAHIPYVGPALFQQVSVTYLGFALPVVIWFILYRTRHGLNLRAIGESPATADVAGIPVNRWRLVYTSVGGAFAGLGGAMLTLGIVGSWEPNVTAGEGWLAMIIVIFASWRPFRLIGGALLFGGLSVLGSLAEAYGWGLPSELLSAMPYIGTFGGVCILGWLRVRQAGWPPWPAALGEPFFRGSKGL